MSAIRAALRIARPPTVWEQTLPRSDSTPSFSCALETDPLPGLLSPSEQAIRT